MLPGETAWKSEGQMLESYVSCFKTSTLVIAPSQFSIKDPGCLVTVAFIHKFHFATIMTLLCKYISILKTVLASSIETVEGMKWPGNPGMRCVWFYRLDFTDIIPLNQIIVVIPFLVVACTLELPFCLSMPCHRVEISWWFCVSRDAKRTQKSNA
jgi:hypothetical protein